MNRIFSFLFKKLQTHKVWAIAGFLGLLILGVYAVMTMRYQEDITQLIPSNEKSKNLQKVLKTVDFSDKIILNIAAENEGSESQLKAYANQLIDSLEQKDSVYIEKIQGKVSQRNLMGTYDFMYAHLPLFMEAKDYQSLQNRLQADSLQARLQADYQALLSPAGAITKKYVQEDPLQFTPMALTKLKNLEPDGNFELVDNFLFTNNRKNLLLFLSPKELNAAQQEHLVDDLYRILDNLDQTETTVSGEAFGSILYSVANARQIKTDIQVTVSIAIAILLFILILFYRKLTLPILLFLPTLLGALVALIFLRFYKGELSLISLGIGSVLLGITLDYALHTLTHFRNNGSVKKLFKEVANPVMMSSLTTAAAFICLLFLKSEALQDLGIFAAISVLSAGFFALLIIPLFYKKRQPELMETPNVIDKIAAYSFDRNTVLVVFIGLLFVGSCFFFYRVRFNEDLSALNYQPEKLQSAEKHLNAISNQNEKTVYLVASGNTINEALLQNNVLYNRLKKQLDAGEISHISSLGGLVLSAEDQQKRITQWKSFWNRARIDSLSTQLRVAGQKSGFKASAFIGFVEHVEIDYQPIGLKEYQAVSNLYLDEFLKTSKDGELVTILSSVKIPKERVSAFLKEFKNAENTYVIDREALNESFLGSLKQDFNHLLWYSFGAIFIILLLFYRNLKISVFTLLPIGITWVITLGLMAIFEVEFNIFNIIISTFIFGLGIDYSIFITNGLLHGEEEGQHELTTHKTSILLSVITTLLGIGALIFAQHPALQSVSLVSIIGILSAALVSFTIQPFLYRRFFRSKK